MKDRHIRPILKLSSPSGLECAHDDQIVSNGCLCLSFVLQTHLALAGAHFYRCYDWHYVSILVAHGKYAEAALRYVRRFLACLQNT